MEVVRHEGFILSGDCKLEFDEWYKSSIFYTPLFDIDKSFWNQPYYVVYPIINLFFDDRRYFVNTLLNPISCVGFINGKEVGVFRNRKEAWRHLFSISNSEFNLRRFVEKFKHHVKLKTGKSKDEIENHFTTDNIKKYFFEGYEPIKAAQEEIQHWQQVKTEIENL